MKSNKAQQGVVADGSRLHFGPWSVEAEVSGDVPVRAGKRARG
jgi:hypothetical protein